MVQIGRSVCLAGLFLWSALAARADFTSPAKNISNSALDSMYPKIAGTDGSSNLFLIWMEYVDMTEQHLYFARSTNSGATWSAPLQLTSGGQLLSAYDGYVYSVAVAEPYIHVVYNWRINDADDWEIYYVRSDDLGETWDSRQLTSNSSSSLWPDVAAQGEYAHVTYQDDWPGNFEVMYKRIDNYGAGAVDQTRRLTFSGTDSHYPKIAVSSSGESVNIVYEDWYNGAWNLFYKHLYGSGAGLYDTRQLTFGAQSNWDHEVATSGAAAPQYVYIVYEALWPGNSDVMYKRLDNWGQSGFSTYTARLTISTTDSINPAVDFDTGYNSVHISYDDDWPGNSEVMYRRLGDFGGDGFLGQRVSWGTGFSMFPTLTSSGFYAYVAWMDNTSGNFEIYVKYGY